MCVCITSVHKASRIMIIHDNTTIKWLSLCHVKKIIYNATMLLFQIKLRITLLRCRLCCSRNPTRPSSIIRFTTRRTSMTISSPIVLLLISSMVEVYGFLLPCLRSETGNRLLDCSNGRHTALGNNGSFVVVDG